MCLTVGKGGALVAAKDIEVLKVVAVPYSDPGVWSPVMYNTWRGYPFGEVCEETGTDEAYMRRDRGGSVLVEGGYFHSTGSRGKALTIHTVLCGSPNLSWGDVAICDAVIPAGTRYYTDGVDYASERIIVKER